MAAHGDWSVTARWQDGSRSLDATFGHGLPFVYFRKNGTGDALVRFAAPPQVLLQTGPVLKVKVNGKTYGLFAPAGSGWSVAGQEARAPLPNQGNFSVAVLPDDAPATFDAFRKRAYAYVTDTRVTWTYEPGTAEMVTRFDVTTELAAGAEPGALNETVMALYRHQWLNTPASFLGPAYGSPRGAMKIVTGKSFTTRLPVTGILPNLPKAAISGQENFSDATLNGHLAAMANSPAERWPGGSGPTRHSLDSYWMGKALHRLAELVPIAEQQGNSALRDQLLSEIKTGLEDWLDGQGGRLLYYDGLWKTIIGFPDSYGSNTVLNDHHFHWGYFIGAAAVVARYDKAWAAPSRWGGMIELLAKDAANPDRADTRFPFLRSFDPYAGHSWANGPSLFAAGNNQESSSESMHFAAALARWGMETGNHQWRDLGLYLYATEASAIAQYWFDVDQAVFPSGYHRPSTAIVWGDGGAYAIWWDGFVEELHGINFLPITAASLYLARHPDYLRINQASMEANGGGNDVWRDIHISVRSMYDPPGGAAELAARANYAPEWGDTRARAYHWVHHLHALGTLNPEVYANVPSFAAFDRGPARTYVAYNPTGTAQTVVFSDGGQLVVPARSLASSLGGITQNPNPAPAPTPDPSPAPGPAPSPNPAPSTGTAVVQADGRVLLTFQPSGASRFVDVHYIVDQAGQLNYRMVESSGGSWSFTTPPVANGAKVRYFFTYERGGLAYDTAFQELTVQRTEVPSTPSPSSAPGTGTAVAQADGRVLLTFQPSGASRFVDVHYIVDQAGQLNYRMAESPGGSWSFTTPPVANGAKVRYFFTYERGSLAYDTAFQELTVPGSGDTAQPPASLTPGAGSVRTDVSTGRLVFTWSPGNVPSQWVDVHYVVGNYHQQNFRMVRIGDHWQHVTLDTVPAGTPVRFHFTYEKSGLAYDTPWTSR